MPCPDRVNIALMLLLFTNLAESTYIHRSQTEEEGLFKFKTKAQFTSTVDGMKLTVEALGECSSSCLSIADCVGFAFKKPSNVGETNCKLSKTKVNSQDYIAHTEWHYYEMAPNLKCIYQCDRFKEYPVWKEEPGECICTPLGIVSTKKPATQSSTYGTFDQAFKAVDGNKNGFWVERSCSCTKATTSPWWRVDLQEKHYVGAVRLSGRADCCAADFKNGEIRVGMSLLNNGNSNPLCTTTIPSLSLGETKEFQCNLNYAYGRYVNILIKTTNILTLCEVEVIGIQV